MTGQGGRKEGKAKEGCVKTMALYGETLSRKVA